MSGPIYELNPGETLKDARIPLWVATKVHYPWAYYQVIPVLHLPFHQIVLCLNRSIQFWLGFSCFGCDLQPLLVVIFSPLSTSLKVWLVGVGDSFAWKFLPSVLSGYMGDTCCGTHIMVFCLLSQYCLGVLNIFLIVVQIGRNMLHWVHCWRSSY